MPMMISQNEENNWLNENDNTDFNFYNVKLEIIPVSQKVNNPQYSDPSCIKKTDEYQIFFN